MQCNLFGAAMAADAAPSISERREAMMTGCVALLVGQLCFMQDKITCSDVEIQGIETCKAQFQRLGVATSSTTAATWVTIPPDPHVGNQIGRHQ
jgi:hypothetical protein